MAPLTLAASSLSSSNRHRKLYIISPDLTTPHTTIGNQGTSTKTPDIAPCTNSYKSAPSGQPGRPVLSASRCKPRTTTSTPDGEVLQVGFLERHPFSTQSFVPMGGNDAASYVVLVAESDAAGSKPDVSTLRAYTVSGDQGICYDVGLWHAPMAVIGESLDFAVFQFSNGVDVEDCEMLQLEDPIHVILRV